MKCENCGNENVEIITKEIGYICPVCCRNTARMAELYGSDNYPEWVPVSERLPEDCVPVNVTWINRKPEPYYKITKT